MIISKEGNQYKAVQKLPNGALSVGTGDNVKSAIAWAMWGVKGYFARLRRDNTGA